ncbi:nuclear transport factor 2 family protein [Nocardia sp. NBC_00416]|uniref:nuclear transport factor 2 family protein n=1 Tax=Nocardia sp. NBC_00416 TaxID=2975991 RepID=UPI002E1D1601
MALSVADQLEIQQVIALHGHLSDTGAFDRFDEVFTEDVGYDLSAFGSGVVHGIGTLRDMAVALGDRNPLGHHVTNTIITDGADVEAKALSKGLAVNTDGTTASVTYQDVLRRTPAGWRIVHRRITPRRTPLSP